MLANLINADHTALVVTEAYEGLGGFDIKTGKYFARQLPADRPGVLTIGHGHVLSLLEKTTGKYKNGLTRFEVDDLFERDRAPRKAALLKLIPAGRWKTPGQLAAALSSFFNYEAMWTPGHTAYDAHMHGHYEDCARGILLYHYSAGKPQLGLWRRRMTEALLYLTGKVMIAKDAHAEALLEAELRKHLEFVKPACFKHAA